MKFTELRVGNLVMFNGSIRPITTNNLCDMEFHTDATRPYCKPVPITEELLLKCGFKDIYNKMWLILDGSPNIEINKSTFKVSVWETIDDETEGIYLNNIRYLHQLQNLYFALTGQELEIDL